MKILLKTVSFVLGLVILLIFGLYLVNGVESLSSLLGCDLDNVSILRHNKEYVFSLTERFPVLLLVGLIILTFAIYIFARTQKIIDDVSQGCRFIISYMKDTVRMIMASKVKYFLLLSFLTSIFLGYFFPLTLDEPLTYYDFIKPPFWEALSLYPYPNNHVFSSLLSNITNELGFVDILFRIRIPAIIVSLLTWVFAYRFVRKFYSENIALFVVAIGTVVVTNLQHAYIARGYAYVMFFVVIGLYAAYNIIYNNNRRGDWLAFAISSALGAWTMPSYLYPFLSISIFIFIYNYKNIKTQILYSILVGLLVFIFYSPILLISGLESLTSNEYVETIDRMVVLKSLPGFLLGVVVHIFYAPYYLLIALFVLVLLYVLIRKDKNTLVLWLIFGLTPCLFLSIHSVIPFFRTFFYYGFIFIFLIGISFKDILSSLNLNKLFIGLLIVHILMLAYFFSISKKLMYDVFLSYELREQIIEDNKSYYFQNNISWIEMLNLEFEADRRSFKLKIDSGPLSDYSKLQEYDYCILEQEGDRTTTKKPFLKTKSVFSTPVNVYGKDK